MRDYGLRMVAGGALKFGSGGHMPGGADSSSIGMVAFFFFFGVPRKFWLVLKRSAGN